MPARRSSYLAPVFRALAVLALCWGFACLPSVCSEDTKRDPVAQWEIERVALDLRVSRLPASGATLLILPLGAPADRPPARLTAGQLEAVLEKLDLYSGPAAPVHIDGVVLEINATQAPRHEDLMKVDQLVRALQIHDFPVIAWVHAAALDETAWIALSADRIFLAPGAQFGGGPPDPLRDAAEQNDAQMAAMVSANARYAGEVASSKGYNRDIARAMVDGSVTLVRAAIDGRPYVLTEETLAAVRKARPGAAVETGPRYKKSGDRLCLTPVEALRPEIHMAQATTASRAELFEHLGLQQAHAIELSFTGPPPATIANGLQAGLFLLVLFLALLLIIGELIMETRGYAFVAAGGTILAYLSWSARTAPLGQWALGLFLAAVALFILELLRPTRDGRLGVFCFAVIGHCLALSLIQDAPYLSPDWAARHLDAERRPALQNVALVLAGGTLAGAAVGLMTIARLRRLPRYRRRWRKRFTHWDEGAYLELQRQRGKFGVSLTPITSLAAQPRAGGGFGFSEGGGGILPNAIGASTGRVSLDGQQYEATCVGAIAAGCEIEVMDCTEDRLVVRLRPNTQHAVPPFELPSKYEAMDAQTKYAGDAGNDVLKYPPTEGAEDTPKYPPEADAPKYTDVRDRSKYTPPGGSVTPPKTNDQR